ncbi:MAG: hypothetical protein KAH01_00375, partial [Caldisericia bacterium]|nr:hypothetical protein [Caldisericia bacterium]
MAACSLYSANITKLIKSKRVKVVVLKDKDNEGSSKKTLKFPFYSIPTSSIYKLVTSNIRTGTNSPFKVIMRHIDNASIAKKLAGAINLSSKKRVNPMLKGLDPKNESESGMKLIGRAFVMEAIFSAQSSEKDASKIHGLSEEENSDLITEGSRIVNVSGLAQTIGRKIAQRQKYTVRGKTTDINAYYHNLGMNAIYETEQNTDMITIIGQGKDKISVINAGYKKDQISDYAKNKTLIDGVGVYINLSETFGITKKKDQKEVLRLLESGRSIKESDSESVSEELKIVSATSMHLNTMSSSSTEKTISEEAEEDVYTKEINTTPASMGTMKEMQSKPSILDGGISSLFQYFSKKIASNMQDMSSGKFSFMDILKEFPLTKQQKIDIFGDMDFINGNTDLLNSERGKMISKTQTIQHVAQNANLFWEENG